MPRKQRAKRLISKWALLGWALPWIPHLPGYFKSLRGAIAVGGDLQFVTQAFDWVISGQYSTQIFIAAGLLIVVSAVLVPLPNRQPEGGPESEDSTGLTLNDEERNIMRIMVGQEAIRTGNVPSIEELIRRVKALSAQRQSAPPSEPKPPPDLEVRYVIHKVESGEERNNNYHQWWLTVVFDMEARTYSRIREVALILGGEPVMEYTSRSGREILGKDQWEVLFAIPSSIRPGEHTVHISIGKYTDANLASWSHFDSDDFKITIP